jgi:homogentisate 1,2-dioxygenase
MKSRKFLNPATPTILSMPHYLQLGSIPPKRHIEHPNPDNPVDGIYYEEVITLEGFNRAYSIVYHLAPPTVVDNVEPAGSLPVDIATVETLRHHHLKSAEMDRAGDILSGRVPMLTNADVTIHRCRPATDQAELYRNAMCDEVIFVQHGSGVLHSQFGKLPFKDLDYIVVPKCTTFEIKFDIATQADLLIIESASSVRFPKRYLNDDGQFRLGAPLYERDLHGPTELPPPDQRGPTNVLIKDGQRLSRYSLATHPFDVVGWDGMVYPYTFNAMDFEPITGTIHQPPPIHQTFQTDGFVVCTFAPRLLDTHPQAVKVPYAHSNVESDEVLYYVLGEFGSRRGVDIGSFTLHPHGIPHGPHPGTIAASRNATRTNELAVMVDTFRPLHLTQQAVAMDDPTYPYSWQTH